MLTFIKRPLCFPVPHNSERMSAKQMHAKPAVLNTTSGAPLFAALFILAAWLGLLLWLVANSDATEVIWARWLVVTSSLEAVAFAAAGAIFGTTVQGQRVAEAREQAVASDDRATKAVIESRENLKDAASGRALSDVVKKKKGRKRKSKSSEGFQDARQEEDDDDDDLVAIAESLFPD